MVVLKKLEDMTPDELRDYANKKENEHKVIKTATVAEDIYAVYSLSDFNWIFNNMFGEPIDEGTLDKLLQTMKEECLIAKKGNECECYLDDAGECWYDKDGGIADWGSEDAKKWFKDIKEK